MVLGKREQAIMLDLTDALGASLDLHEVLRDSYGLLLRLVGADYGALATSRPECPEEYEWIVQDLPPSFLGSYEEMAPHDFVRSSVLAKVNVVLRDSEMIDRRGLERNMMYHRAREVGAPLEQVMAVMLHAGGGFQSGLSLYREERRSFDEREQRILQRLTVPLGNAVRNCRRFAKMERWSNVSEALLGSNGGAVVLVRPPARELERSVGATALLDTWFGAGRSGRLPQLVLEWLAEANAARLRGDERPLTWKVDREDAVLKVELLSLPASAGEAPWALRFQEVTSALPVPAEWQVVLTATEHKVVQGVLRGWDNGTIAKQLSERGRSLHTVKKHMQNILRKLDLADRNELLSMAARAAREL